MSFTHEIGLTGGIACGKSTLAEGLRARGWHIVDTDRIAHQLLQPGQAVVISEMEHHSNLVPWQMLAERAGARIEWVPVLGDEGLPDMAAVRENQAGSAPPSSITYTARRPVA